MDNRLLVNELEISLAPIAAFLARFSDAILDQDISRYPIFVLSENPIEIGVPVLEKNPDLHRWYISASTLEELAAKQIVGMEKVNTFRTVFKDPHHFFCLLVITEQRADFIFMPRNI